MIHRSLTCILPEMKMQLYRQKTNIRICVIGLHRIFCITGKTPRSV